MAKKKNNLNKKKTAEKKSMISKIEIKDPRDNDRIARLVGTFFVIVGLLLIAYGIFSFIKYNKNPELNESFTKPTLAGTEVVTKEENILIKGEAEGYSDVFVYVDNEQVGKADVKKDGKYEYSYKADDEGKYIVSVAGVKGFPKRYLSPKSDPMVITVDRTAPEVSEMKFPTEVGTTTFALAGKSEPNSEITLKRGTESYSVKSDDNGNFKLLGIALDEGPNVFNAEIKDSAGNVKKLNEKVEVIYSEDSSVNGNAVADSDLPIASGELETALSVLRDNRIMSIFGLLGLVTFVTTSGILVRKNRVENN